MQDMAALIQAIPGYKPERGEEIYQQMLDDVLAEMDGTITARLKYKQLQTLRQMLLTTLATQLNLTAMLDGLPMATVADTDAQKSHRRSGAVRSCSYRFTPCNPSPHGSQFQSHQVSPPERLLDN